MSFENIPEELKALTQWVCWSLQDRAGKKVKLPINPRSGKLASATDPSTWSTYDQAVKSSVNFHGIGFVFSDNDPYFGLDMDGHVDMELIGFMDTYAERSQSGKGAHIIGRGKVGAGKRNTAYEVYDRERYFIMTGNVITAKPIRDCQQELDSFMSHLFPAEEKAGVDLTAILSRPDPVSEADIFDRIRSSSQADKFERLWRGDFSDYGSQSEADAALLSILRFWTGGDKARSLALFEQSGLVRPKWKRSDYRERTWSRIDSGEVYEMPEAPISRVVAQQNLAPWRAVTLKHVEQAITGTIIEPMVRALRAPMEPPLPLSIALLKALTLAGCALSQRAENDGGLSKYVAAGAEAARVRILTAGGQVANFWTLIIAPSGIGKDAGNLLDRVAQQKRWLIGNAGSEEGIADAYMRVPNGLLSISEMSNWLDENHWQNRAAGFLTNAFNKGFFNHAMSQRSKNVTVRQSDYCYPNIFAAIQPGVLETKIKRFDLDSGFVGRFLIAAVEGEYFGNPVCGDLKNEARDLLAAVDALCALKGTVSPPHKYAERLAKLFIDHKAEPQATWRRLCNEYYPRLALILSVPAAPPHSEAAVITEDGWAKAEVLVQWFFAQAELALDNLCFDPAQQTYEALCRKILNIVHDAGGKCTKTEIHTKCRRTKAMQREEVIRELQSRGDIIVSKHMGHTMLEIPSQRYTEVHERYGGFPL